MGAMGLVLLSTIFTAFGQVYFKKASNNLSPDVIALLTNYPMYFGFLLYAIGAVLLIISLKYGELSVLYPIYATNFVWVSILFTIYFGDVMNIYKWGGVFVILIGILFVGAGSKNG